MPVWLAQTPTTAILLDSSTKDGAAPATRAGKTGGPSSCANTAGRKAPKASPRVFTEADRASAVGKVVAEGKTKGQVANLFGLEWRTVDRWVLQHSAHDAESPTPLPTAA